MTLENSVAKELLEALILNLEDSFPQLLDTYDRQLYRYVVGQIHSEQSAEDILQESWIHIYQALGRYPEEKIRSLKLQSWLFAIVHNEMCTYMRKKNALNTVSIEELGENIENDEAFQPQDSSDLKIRLEEVKEVITYLSPTYRSILTLHFFQGLSYQEIADQLEKPVGTVRTYVHRGLHVLREKLAANVN